MKYIKNISLFILGFFFLTSCEDVIELDLENTEPRIVIEANLETENDSLSVLVTKTNGFYEDGAPARVTNALITISDEDGNTIELSETQDGLYELTGYSTEPGKEYELSVATEGEEYIATTLAPQKVAFTAIDTIFGQSPFGGNLFFYQALFRWQDPANESNYYQVQAIRNDTILGQLSIYNDDGLDGQLFVRPLMDFINEDELVEFRLINWDAKSYDYFVQIAALQQQGFGGSTPFNPKGNFSNKALGYFGIRTTDRITIQF